MKEWELFEYIDQIEDQNNIDGIPLDQLKLTLSGNEQSDYVIKVGSISTIILAKKGESNLIKLKCVKSYYDLNINGKKGNIIPCKEIKDSFDNRMINNCVHENCAKCHLCCIDDFYDNKISKL